MKTAVVGPIDQPLPVAPPPREKVPRLNLAELVGRPRSEAAVVVRRFEADRGALTRSHAVPLSPTRAARLKKFYSDWLVALKGVDFEKVSPAAREELVNLRSQVETELKEIDARAAEAAALSPVLPFAETVIGLEEARRRMEPVDAPRAAGQLHAVAKQLAKLRAGVETAGKSGEFAPGLPATRPTANRAADATDSLRAALRTWHGFYDGYDPLFTWWVAEPYKQADAALAGYAKLLRQKAKDLPDGEKTPPSPVTITAPAGPSDAPDLAALLAAQQSEMAAVIARYRGPGFGRGGGGGGGGRGAGGPGGSDRDTSHWLHALKEIPFDTLSRPAQVDYVLLKTRLDLELKRAELREKGTRRPAPPKDDTGIVGRPIGREALLVELAGEMIPYTPEELIALAREELAWCDAEMLRASREMGFGDDWKKATEKVKTLHVQPGQQPRLIRDLAVEAIEYLKTHDLVTVPPLAAETWRMNMMSPERQLVNPFFTGGEVISVSFPTNTMSHEAKLQSMRGNNVHFARATVHHELIPGHHLQQFMNGRNHPHRGLFSTPFWGEGWALYWEFVLYDKGFARTPEDRVGFLTWRKHRCARVIFSLEYHLGRMTPRECIDLLVDRVGFEPENATAEVRRSFATSYGPLYQCAYLLGGMQFWALRKELVDSGKMTERAFHDAVLAEHSMPVAMVRAILTGQTLDPFAPPEWRFAGPAR